MQLFARAFFGFVGVFAIGCGSHSAATLERTEQDAVDALRRGELTAAESLATQGLESVRSEPGSVGEWTFRLLRAESWILQRKFTDAQSELAHTLPSDHAFDSLRARQKYLLARTDVQQGRYRDALNKVQEGLKIPCGSAVRFDLDDLAGQIQFRIGQRVVAEEELKALVAAAQAVGDRYHEALALNDLGMGRLSSNRFDEALPWFERLLSFRDLEGLTIYSFALLNAGICHVQLGEFDKAIDLQRRAVTIHERHGATQRLERALGELGRTYLDRGDAAQAMPYLLRALEIARQSHLDTDFALLAGNLALTDIELGRWDDAARFNDESMLIRRGGSEGRLSHNILNAAKIAEGRGHREEAGQLYENALAASVDEPGVRWDANAGLARLAMADRNQQRATEYFERALEIIEQTRSDLQKTDYKLSYLSSLIQFYREYVDALIAQGRIDRALEIADSSRGRVLAERQRTASPARATAARFRRTAERSGKVILFYWLQAKTSWLWVVTAKDIHLVPLPAGDQIEALVREHQKMIGSALADPLAADTTPGDKLYEALVAPASPWIPSGASLLIVPDGALHGLNFETLPVNPKGPNESNNRHELAKRHYWIEDVEIQIVPSLGLLADARSNGVSQAARSAALPRITADPPAQSLLLIGSPAVSDAKFPALSYASSEMAKVAHHFGSSAVVSYEGPRASPVAYRNAEPDRFKMIHFTAHAAANVESPLDSAVILSAQDGSYKLYARDIADLPLHAELVTVSACRSAGERTYSGEGLIGFAWAFLRAGAKRVIAGLWDVDDQSTAGLMDGLYARIAAGAPPSRALREAKLSMMRQGGTLSKPYYWGPFELFTVAP
jgi:CHAT domain-containing protein